MKRRFAVMVLTDSVTTPRSGRFSRFLSSVLPGSRLQNYLEFLSGSGIPFEPVQVRDFSPERVVDAHTIHFSAILLACRPRETPEKIRTLLAGFSSRFGISLIADAFLFADETFQAPFGIKSRSIFPRFSGRILDVAGNVLYRAVPHPYSPKGADWGVRPSLRFLLQSWFAKKIEIVPEARIEAMHGNGLPAVVVHSLGKAANYFLNFHPALVLKDGAPIHGLLRRLIASNAHAVPVSKALEGIGVLRLDDPGSAERVHLEGFNDGVLSARAWREIIDDLQAEAARLNVAAVPSWVDDGDAGKGVLTVGGRVVNDRIPGAHYPAWEVKFRRKDRSADHDYVAPFKAIREGVRRGVLSILSHGLTHITPQQDRWLAAGDRFTNSAWYREFSKDTNGVAARMNKSARLLSQYFGIVPAVLVPSGHKFTPNTPGQAGLAGFKVFSAKSTFLLEAGNIFENRKLRAVYPEETSEGAALAEAGYPVILVLHDYDLLIRGPARLREMIQWWRKRGIHSFPSLETLALAVAARLEAVSEEDGSVRVEVDLNAFPPDSGKDPVFWLKIGGRPVSAEVNGNPRNEDLKWTGKATLFPVRLDQAIDGRLCLVLGFGEGA